LPLVEWCHVNSLYDNYRRVNGSTKVFTPACPLRPIREIAPTGVASWQIGRADKMRYF